MLQKKRCDCRRRARRVCLEHVTADFCAFRGAPFWTAFFQKINWNLHDIKKIRRDPRRRAKDLASSSSNAATAVGLTMHNINT